MIIAIAQQMLTDNVGILKSRVSKIAYQGVCVAIVSIIFANLIVSFYLKGELSIDGIMEAQKNNFALWMLYCVPFLFAFWGQHSGSVLIYEFGAMIVDQTQNLRVKAEILKEQADHAATHDVITNLPNRALFYDRVQQAILNASYNDRVLSVFLIELENFKEIYDTLGLSSSDVVIREITTRLLQIKSDMDTDTGTLARIDGNIFSLLMVDLQNTDQAITAALKIGHALETPMWVKGLNISVQSSVGLVHYPEHGSEVDTLVQKAGIALSMAHKSPKGFAVYDPRVDKNSSRRLTLMSELRLAIEADQLELFYQPKVNISTGTLYGAEALVRWNHATLGLIPPEEFVPMAERTRMIKPLTNWVLKKAFLDSANWHKQGLALMISINLSARDMHDPELPDHLADLVGSTDVKPEWIILEITESSIMTDPVKSLEIIERLDRMGFMLSIDDYGTGYSSLAYLKQIPLTELKIDRSFMRDLLDNENNAVIVNATINLAHNLNLQVTAEGVENAAILARLKEYGCDIAQGYYISRPLSVPDFDKWMVAAQWKREALTQLSQSMG